MKWIPALALMPLLFASCKDEKPQKVQVSAVVHRTSIYEAALAHLITDVSENPISRKFVGSKALVIPEWNDGDSLFYGIGDESKISEELFDALRAAAKTEIPFPAEAVLGPNATLTNDRPLNYLSYYGDEVEPIQGKCFVSFWRPGYSKDGKKAIIRAWYGPASHDSVATYLLSETTTGWKIDLSSLDSYP